LPSIGSTRRLTPWGCKRIIRSRPQAAFIALRENFLKCARSSVG